MSPEAIDNHHVLSIQHVEKIKWDFTTKKRSFEDKRMLFSKVSKSMIGQLVVDSKWLHSTLHLDEIWDNMVVDHDKKKSQESSVYFIRIGDSDWVKIGHSTNVIQRMSCLQVSCPIELSLEFAIMLKDAYTCEQNIHTVLKKRKDCHVRGEWFKLPWPTDTMAILKESGVLN